jgi:hypothetical protein
VSKVSEASAEYCVELGTRFHEDGGADSEGKFLELDQRFRELEDANAEFCAIRRKNTYLKRDDYPSRNWLYDHPHEELQEAKAELNYWTAYIWKGELNSSIGSAWTERGQRGWRYLRG